MSQPGSRKPFGLWAYLGTILATVVVAALAGAAAAIFGDRPGWLGIGIHAAFISVAMAAGMALCVWWWRGIDEAAQEAHKSAWWWGGTGGMAVGGVILLSLVMPGQDDFVFDGFSGQDIFAVGMGVVVMSQVVGYTVAWAVWWLRHR